LIVSPADLRRVLETSALVKGSSAIYDEIVLRVTDYGFKCMMGGTALVYVFNDYKLTPFNPEDLVDKRLCLRAVELTKLLKSNFKVDETIRVEEGDGGNSLIFKGSRDYLKVSLSGSQIPEPRVEGFKQLGGVEFPVGRKEILPKYVFRLDVAYLKEVEIEGETLSLEVQGNSLYVRTEGMTYDLRKQLPCMLTYGETPEFERYRFSKAVFQSVIGSLEGNVYLGFLGYDENNTPRPVWFSQREPNRNFKLAYFVMVQAP